MKWVYPALSAVLMLSVGLTQSPGQTSSDLHFPQSTPKPKPAWVKLTDQGQNDPRLKGYFTPEGVKVEIVADFPTVVNPVGLTFGPDGSLYVLEWAAAARKDCKETPVEFTYKDGSKRKFTVLKKPVQDRVKLLLDAKGQGVYDEARVILEDELPSGILIHDSYLYLAGQGTVRRYKQTKPEGPYGKAEVIAQGFSSLHPSQVSGLTIGNDGWLYITSGDGDNFVEGSDESRADALRTGAVFRCQPDGSKLHTVALGFCNPRGNVAFDALGNLFHVDDDSAGDTKFTGCRLLHLAEEADFGWRCLPGVRGTPDPDRAAVWGDLPGKLTALLKTGPGMPTGLLIYNDTFFPKEFQGLLYYPDPLQRSIRAYQVKPQGATFEVTQEFEFLKSDDPLFRPGQMVLGPDGAMYVCDSRTDPTRDNGLDRNGKHGRIYRITWGGTKDQPAITLRGLDSWTRISKQSEKELLKTLASENASDRLRAQQELARRGPKQRSKVLKVLTDEDAAIPARIAALGALQSMWSAEVSEAFQKLLGHPHNDLRRLAAEGLALNAGKEDKKVLADLVEALSEPDPAVKRALVLAIGKVGGEGAADALVNMLRFDESKDANLRDGIIRGLERLGKPGIEALVNLGNSGGQNELDLAVNAFVSLRTSHGAEALPAMLNNVHLSNAQKVRLIESYNHYLLDPPVALAPVVMQLEALVKGMPKALMLGSKKQLDQIPPLMLACLKVLAASKEIDNKNVQQTILEMLKLDTGPQVRQALAQVVEKAQITEAGPLLVQTLAMMGARQSAEERQAFLKALGTLKEESAVTVLEKMITEGKNPDSAEEKAVQLEALRTLGSIAPDRALKGAKAFLESDDRELQAAAIAVAGATPAGAKLVGQLFLNRKIPVELRPQVTQVLSLHAMKNGELKKLLAEVMKQAS